MASLAPTPLRPSLQKSRSSQKKTVTIKAPAHSSHKSSPTSPMFENLTEAPSVKVIEPAYVPLEKTITVRSAEVPADTSSSEEEREMKVTKGKKRLSLFWRRRGVPIAVTAA